MPARRVIASCPGCGKPVLLLAELDWLPADLALPDSIPLARIQQLAEAHGDIPTRKRKLFCLQSLCGRRFSVYVPETGSDDPL